MNDRISRLELYPDEILSIKKEIINVLEVLWKRMTYTKDFDIRGLICCTDKKREVTFVFNDRGKGSEENPNLKKSEREMFALTKYGTTKRMTLASHHMTVAETLVRQKLEAFFDSKYPDFDFKAKGIVVLFDGAREVHMRLERIRNIKNDNEVIVLDDDDDDEAAVVADKLAETEKQASVLSVSSEGSSTAKRQIPNPPIADKENTKSLTELRAYMSHFFAVQKRMADKARENGTEAESSTIKQEAPTSPMVLNSLNRSLPIDVSAMTRTSVKRSSTFRGDRDRDRDSERQKRRRLSCDFDDGGGTAYECKHCGESFVGQRNYVQHTKSRHGRVPCYICGSTFTQKGNMERHMNSHFGNKLFKCDQCNSSYTRLESLQSHKARHH